MTEAKNAALTVAQGSSQPAALRMSVSKIKQFYSTELEKSLAEYSIKPDAEQINCVTSLLSEMSNVCNKEGITIKEVDQTNLMTILQQCAMLRLNVAAVPRECYLILRNQKNGSNWVKTFEFGLQGDGNDKLVRKYGVNVTHIYPYWVVREGDDFTYPAFKGLEMTPPTWTPHGGSGKYVRVVYPIEYTDGTVQYHIAEREDVAVNLKAHIINNTKMNKGLTDKEKESIRAKLQDMTLDQIFADPGMLQYMSPAWRDPHSRESMILRKMRNNALKPIPRDFGDAYVAQAYEDTQEDRVIDTPAIDPEKAVDAEVDEKSGTEKLSALPQDTRTPPIDAVTGEVLEDAKRPENGPQKATQKVRPF